MTKDLDIRDFPYGIGKYSSAQASFLKMKEKNHGQTQKDKIAAIRFSRALSIICIGIFFENCDTDLRERFIASVSRSKLFDLEQAVSELRDHSSYDYLLRAYSDVLAVNNRGISIEDELMTICSGYQNSDSSSSLTEE